MTLPYSIARTRIRRNRAGTLKKTPFFHAFRFPVGSPPDSPRDNVDYQHMHELRLNATLTKTLIFRVEASIPAPDTLLYPLPSLGASATPKPNP